MYELVASTHRWCGQHLGAQGGPAVSPRSWLSRFAPSSGPGLRCPPGQPAKLTSRLSTGRRMAVDDCEAFLLGSLAEYRLGHGQSVAPWEWTNLLAHGGEEALRGEVADGHRLSSPEPPGDQSATWRAARSYLIAELLGLAETCGALPELQRQVVVPLELELAARAEACDWRPKDWLLVVDAEFSAHRRAALQPFHRDPRLP